jgi:single-stranded-DNA-specific exonuclease
MSLETQHINQEHYHPVILKLLEQRGFDTKEKRDAFFSEDLRKLPNLTDIPDIHKAAARIVEAIEQNQNIGIYGDYDVDGTTSCAVFYHFFQSINRDVFLFQPSRFDEGYGLHCSSIEKALDQNIDLLITVDCGITNDQAAKYSKERGLDLIITDHHKDILEEMPPAYAVINPNRRDCPEDSPLRKLAGVGVAFAVCLEIRNQMIAKEVEVPSLYPLLQFVAIGTICDLVPLNLMNMKLVRHGLKQLPKSQFAGVKAFLNPEERTYPATPSEKLSFNIGPMINSKGRVDHPEMALSLLTAEDSDEAFHLYSHLEVSNKERKAIQSEVYKEAKEQTLSQMKGDHTISIVYQPHWHEGVIGIVASRLVEQFKVPAIVFTDAKDEGVIKASARTAGELSIFHCLEQCQDLFLKFGGHKAAAGLSMPKDNFEQFKEKMTGLVSAIPEITRTEQESFDLEIDANDVDAILAKQLEKLEPFGMGNPMPTFRIRNIKLQSFDILKELHVRWNFVNQKGKQLRGISFNYIDSFDKPHPKTIHEQQAELKVYAKVGVNRFRGNEFLQLQVTKIDF